MCYVRVCLSKTKPNDFGEIGGEINIQGQLTGECDWRGGNKIRIIVLCGDKFISGTYRSDCYLCVRVCASSDRIAVVVALGFVVVAVVVVPTSCCRCWFWGHPLGSCNCTIWHLHTRAASVAMCIYLFIFIFAWSPQLIRHTNTHAHTHARMTLGAIVRCDQMVTKMRNKCWYFLVFIEFYFYYFILFLPICIHLPKTHLT